MTTSVPLIPTIAATASSAMARARAETHPPAIAFPAATSATALTVLMVSSAGDRAALAISARAVAEAPTARPMPRRSSSRLNNSRARVSRLVREFFGQPSSLAAWLWLLPSK